MCVGFVQGALKAADPMDLSWNSIRLTFNPACLLYSIKGERRRESSALRERLHPEVLSESGTISHSVLEMTSIEYIPLKNIEQDYDSSLISMQM